MPPSKTKTPEATRAHIRNRCFIDPNSGCWLWEGATTLDGYGRMAVFYKLKNVHRVSYEAFIGPIPDGMVIDHLCRTRCCANPNHLEPVSQTENTTRGMAGKIYSQRTHCPKGHEYTNEHKPYVDKRGSVHRKCATCNRERSRIYERTKRKRGEVNA